MNNMKKIDIHAHAALYPELLPLNKYSGDPFICGKELIEIYNKLNIAGERD